jgi:hypothetical protein
MQRKKLNELAVTLEKINYLYRAVRKNEQAPKKVELALLKKYVIDLYDGFIELELPETAIEQKNTDQQPVIKEQAPPPPVVVVEEKPVVVSVVVEETPIAAPETVVVVEETPITAPETVVVVEETPLPSTNTAEKDSGILSVLKEKVADLQDDVAHLKANLDETYNNAINTLQGDDTEKTPFKDAAERIDDDYDDSSSKTQILTNPANGGLQNTLVNHDDDDEEGDETIALNVKENPALIDVLGKSSGNRLEFPISFNQRHAFVNQLFGGNEAAYNRAINDLSSSKGYIEALTYINLNLRYDYKWRDDEPAVKEFLDIIKHTFWG